MFNRSVDGRLCLVNLKREVQPSHRIYDAQSFGGRYGYSDR